MLLLEFGSQQQSWGKELLHLCLLLVQGLAIIYKERCSGWLPNARSSDSVEKIRVDPAKNRTHF